MGILQRNWRDYVVTFPPRDGTPSQSRNSQRILAVPWDRRIPKIRISTQQADALQVWITLRFMYSCDQKGNLTLIIFPDMILINWISFIRLFVCCNEGHFWIFHLSTLKTKVMIKIHVNHDASYLLILLTWFEII